MNRTMARNMTRVEQARAPSSSIHAPFVAAEIALILLLGILALIVKHHPGPLTGDAGFEVDVQKVLLPHSFLASPIEAVSTLNWPIPSAVTLAIIFALFLVLRRWLDAIIVPIAAAASSLGTLVLSRWVDRPRPAGHGIHILQKVTGSLSFPSGHVAYGVAVFGLFLFLTFQVRRAVHPALIWGIRVVLLVLIVLMPFSRILEGEHWPSDTLAGVLDGLFFLVLFAHVYLWARARWPKLLAADER